MREELSFHSELAWSSEKQKNKREVLQVGRYTVVTNYP